jgi:mannose-6-phosphate isomerase-like protein (cupin superfamily)
MVLNLEGGCRVVGLKEGEPLRDGGLRVWNHFAGAFSMRVLEIDGTATLHDDALDDVLYDVDKNTSIYLPAGSSLTLDGPATLVSCQCAPTHGAMSIKSLTDVPAQRTGDRWYRELITSKVTQFVGGIPPGRAPDHFHLYEEAICILEGEGVMWAGTTSAPISAGSCIWLPLRQVHCVENRGSGELRLLGVFYPAGSPAVRYAARAD